MKKTYLLYFVLLLAFALGTVSCRETEKIADDIDIPGLGGTEEATNELDEWLFKNFTEPYNIEVIYRWEAAQMYTTISSKLVPIKFDVVQPMMAAIRDVWFTPYNEAAGINFMRRLSPKKVVLVGSGEFQNGSIKLGQAEGGNKILLLKCNDFDPKNEYELKQSLHVIMHEFGHILHQTVMFDKTFQDISSRYYDASGWKEKDRYEAREDYQPESWALGFLRNYAMNGKDDDFVEMLSMILVYGKKWFDEQVVPVAQKSETNPKAYEDLMAKLAMVESYMKSVWHIQLLDGDGKKGLESYVQEAVERVVADPPTM